MRRILFILALIPSLALGQNHEKAKEILNRVTETTQKYQTIKADFSFSLENTQESVNETFEGIIYIKDNKYKAELMNVKTYFDGKTLWTHMIEEEEVNIDEPDPNDEEVLNPATIFGLYKSGFKFGYIGEKQVDGITVHVIDLFPENRDKPYSRIKLLINKDNYSIYSIKQIGKDGNNYTIIVKSMTPNTPMSDSFFVYDATKNPDVDIIDMR